MQPQWYKTSNQLQKENWKIHKYGEIKQMPQNSQWANKTLKRKINNVFISLSLEINENGNTVYQKLWNAVKPVLTENNYGNKSYFKKQEKESQEI